MDPSLSVLLAFLPFALSHIGLAAPRVRSALVERLGVWGFTWLFFAVAALTFGIAISTYAGVRGTGTPGSGYRHRGGEHSGVRRSHCSPRTFPRS